MSRILAMWTCRDSGGTGPPVDEVRPISRDLVWVSGTVIRPISWYGLDTQAHCRMRHVYVMLCHILVTGDHQLHRRGDHLPYHDVELEGGGATFVGSARVRSARAL